MAASTTPSIAYDQRELNKIARVLRTMSEEAIADTKRKVQALADRELQEIRRIASSRGEQAKRIADGGQVKKSSLLGEIKFGFASQKFSGGATTQFNTLSTVSKSKSKQGSVFNYY